MSSGLTFDKILPLILALLLIFIFPMIMRRYGLEPEDLIRRLFGRLKKQDYAAAAKSGSGKNKREPWQSNSRSQDLTSLVSTLLIFVRRNHLGLVYPGTVVWKGKTAGLLALLVTRTEVIGFNCFGFGGTITETGTGWTQHMNGQDQKIPDPLAGNQVQYQLVREMMDANGMKEIPLSILAVFTSRTVTIKTTHSRQVMDTEKLIVHLKERIAGQEGELDPEEIARQLNSHVERITKKKQGSGKK